MEKEFNKDNQFKNLIKKGGLQKPSRGFTDRTMDMVHEASIQKSQNRITKNPWLYLVLALATLPLALSSTLEVFTFNMAQFESVGDIYFKILTYLVVGVFCLIILFQLDHYIRYTFERKKSRQIKMGY
jgi:hypothetical protein